MFRRKQKKSWGQPKTNKKFRKAVIPRNIIKDNVTFIKRTIIRDPESIGVLSTSGWTAFPFSFNVNQIPTWSEFQSLFDSYRVNAIKLTLTPYFSGVDSTLTGPGIVYPTFQPRVYTLIDRNGFPAGSLATENQFIESAQAQIVKKPCEPFEIYIKNPGVEAAVAIGGGFTANAMNKFSPWLDTSNPSVEHWGAAVGMVIPPNSVNGGFFYNVNVTYYMQFRNAV